MTYLQDDDLPPITKTIWTGLRCQVALTNTFVNKCIFLIKNEMDNMFMKYSFKVSLRKRYSKGQWLEAHPFVSIYSAPAQGQDWLSLTWIINSLILSDFLHFHYDVSRSEFLFFLSCLELPELLESVHFTCSEKSLAIIFFPISLSCLSGIWIKHILCMSYPTFFHINLFLQAEFWMISSNLSSNSIIVLGLFFLIAFIRI